MNEEARCPHCHQRAPIMLRGIEARCTVCGRKRTPFSATTLNIAGTPARIGGTVAKGLGCGAGVLGTAVASGIGLLLQAIFENTTLSLAFALPIALLAWAAAISLMLGGRWLSRHGEQKARRSKVNAIRALASHQRGSLTAADAGRTLGCSQAEADALLTELARSPDENIRVDIDDDGVIHYLFGSDVAEHRWRILEERARIAADSDHVAEWQAETEAELHGTPPPPRVQR